MLRTPETSTPLNPDRTEILAATKPEWIDYRQLPVTPGGYSQLFFDYIYDFQEVRQFYPHNFRDSHAIESVQKTVAERTLDRTALVRILNRQNKRFGCGEKAMEHIGLLEKPSTLAVVTGQQVGLFGGPLYTIYKAITTIRLCERLKTKCPHMDFVPVFWVEGEDHDFSEMNNVSVINGEGMPVRIEYLHGGVVTDRNLGPIGELAFDNALEQTFSALHSALRPSEFTTEVIARLKECYAPGKTFNEAFVSWMNFLFADLGLVFITSNDTEIKQILSPLFVREISEFPGTSQLIIAQSAELEERYHAQIKPKSVNLFMFHKGGRYLIEPREHDFSLRGTRHFIQKDELLRIARETPEVLSPNVVLRPIAQDILLPTVAYVAGPSEIAYAAQLKPVYEHFDVMQPVTYPRASGSFVEERLERVLEKYQIDLLRFFEEPDVVTKLVLDQISDISVEDLFGKAGVGISDTLNELKFGIKEIDPTLIGALEGVRLKIEGNLSVLKEKTIAAQKRRNETAVRQIEKAVSTLLPNGNLQERELNIVYYMNKYGPELVKWLYSELEITGFKHQVISL